MQPQSVIRCFIPISSLCVILSGCSLTPSNFLEVTVRANPPAANSRAQAASQMDCYLVNISGNGIPSSNSFSTIDGTCAGLGAISAFVSATQLQSGVSMSVQAGSQRTVQILGVVGAPNCAGSAPADVFDNYAKPLVYILGTIQTDLYMNHPVTVPDNYTTAISQGTPINDVLSSCLLHHDTWHSTNANNAPNGRWQHTAVWTGSKMIIWGGLQQGTLIGGSYDPIANSWLTPINTTNQPQSRTGHTALWTGLSMIIFGGNTDVAGNAGAYFYTPDNAWNNYSSIIAARINHTAVWTGSRMIVYGGTNVSGSSFLLDGIISDVNGSINSNATAFSSQHGRANHTAVWTGSQMLVFGGDQVSPSDPVAESFTPPATWTDISNGAPTPRKYHTAVWTGSEMIIWGGVFNTSSVSGGGRYNPTTKTWNPIQTTNAPSPRDHHTAVWTGSRMIIYGGQDSSGSILSDGKSYDPVADKWYDITSPQEQRESATAVWTGSEMILWGGYGNGLFLSTGNRYTP